MKAYFAENFIVSVAVNSEYKGDDAPKGIGSVIKQFSKPL
jgi:hypothetical protein